MSLRLLLTGLALALVMPVVATAQDTPSATELRLGLVGRWTGALGYRDYQSDELVELPVITTITSPGDGATFVRQSLFDDGPARPVWITTLSLDDPSAGVSISTSFRAGGAPELSTETMAVTAFADPTHWTVTYAETGEDDDAPANIRITETRDGDVLLAIKEVRPVGADDGAWRFRNQTRLTRVGD